MAVNKPVTLSVPIGEGVLLSGQGVVVQKGDGTLIASQWNPLATWRTDSSQLHGVVTFLTPDSGDNTGTFNLVTGTPVTGTAVSKSDLTATAFDAVITAVISGTTYSISAKDLLDGTITPRKDYTHFSGPICSSFCVGHPLLVNGSGSAHANIQGHFEVRAYKISGSVTSVWVSCTLENTGAENVLYSTTASSVTMTVGGSSIQSKSSFTIHADCRYTERAWWGGDPGIYTAIDTDYVQATKLVPTYRQLSFSESELDALPQSATWNSTSNLESTPVGGWQYDLAPLPRYVAMYLMTGDRRAYDAMRATGDAQQWLVGRFDSHLFRPRSETTGHCVDLTVDGRVSKVWDYGSSGSFDANRDGVPDERTDLAHSPQMGFVQYLLSGEFNELESLIFCAWAAHGNERPGGYPGVVPGKQFGSGGQVRSIGWGLRNITLAGVITPTNHPLRTAMESCVTNALQEMADRMIPLDPIGQTGLIITGSSIVYGAEPNDIPDQTATGICGASPWQDQWATWSVGRAAVLGWASELATSGLLEWKAQAIIKYLQISTDWNWAYFPYAFSMEKVGGSGNYFETWAEIYHENIETHPDFAGDIPAGGNQRSANKNGINTTTAGNSKSTTHTGKWWAITAMVDAGVAGADEAYNTLHATATVYDWNDGPESALIKAS